MDKVAFTQEDLADLLDEGVEKIYLCKGMFAVPLNIIGDKGKFVREKVEIWACIC